MKVSFIDDEPEIYPLQYGGKARTIMTLAKGLVSTESVDEVTVMSRSINDSRDRFTDQDGVNFEKLDQHNTLSRIIEAAADADVLSVHTCSFTFPRILPERRKAALVYNMHDVILATADKGSHLDKTLAGDWDAIVSPSDFATTTYLNYASLTGSTSEIYTIPRGIDPALFYEIPKEEAVSELKRQGLIPGEDVGPILFFPGRAGVGKGDDLIEHICESLAGDHPDLLVLTASDADTPLQHPNVRHIGWQEVDNLKYLYSAADITLSLSRLPESFSQVCLQSIACGTPVLAFPFGNQLSFSEELTVIRVCSPEATEVTKAIRSLLDDSDMTDMIGDSKAILENKYHIDSIIKTYVKLYKDIIKRRREPARRPATFFISPNSVVLDGRVYVADEDSEVIETFDLTREESAILGCCAAATSLGEIVLTSGLNYETVYSNLMSLKTRKIVVGIEDGRETR
ncbi:MAG TPA: glycosyltransferase family 4 protein [Candidatus Saccharimonadales bacterium]|nr:glycosyltransferase family 4 protein [Candidatus Saccharimonadales bacterium]